MITPRQWLDGVDSSYDDAYLSLLGVSYVECDSDKIRCIREEILHVVSGVIEKFKPYTIPSLGFDEFSEDVIFSYLFNPEEFNFSFNRKRGEGVLYGIDHVFIRRMLFNNLPNFLRISLFKIKSAHHFIFDALQDHVHCPSVFLGSDWKCDITNVKDIGMGHSVYVVSVDSERWVVKRETTLFQSFYNHLLTLLNYKTFRSFSLSNDFGSWEISEFIGVNTLQDIIKTGTLSLSLGTQLAEHCCLGDVLGRGDRHFENYIVKNDTLYPLDVSILFWPDNESWVQRYLKAGMSEFSALYVDIQAPTMFEFHLKGFFETYITMFDRLVQKKEIVLDSIQRWDFSEEKKREYSTFITERLTNKDYCLTQFKLFSESFTVLCKRQLHKRLLKKLMMNCPEVVLQAPLLKMYYYADRYRMSSFFLIDYLDRDEVLHDISDLANTYLSVSAEEMSTAIKWFDTVTSHVNLIVSESLKKE